MVAISAIPAYLLSRRMSTLSRAGRAADEPLSVSDLRKGYGDAAGAQGRRPRGAAGLADGGARALRLRQDDAAARDRRLRAGRARQRLARRGRTLDDGSTYVPPEKRGHRLRAPGGRPVPPSERRGQRRLRAARGASAAAAPCRELLEMVGIAPLGTPPARTSSPAASSSASRSPGRSPAGRRRCCSTSRSPRWTPRCGATCARRSTALLRAQGVTTVLVTHDQEEALSLADTVAVLRDGRIVQQGPPAELVRAARRQRAWPASSARSTCSTPSSATAAPQTPLGELRAARAGAPASGPGVVMVRPEQIDVTRAGRAGSHRGARRHRTGRVEECRYYGHDALLQIRTEHPGVESVLLARVLGRACAAGRHTGHGRSPGPVSALDERALEQPDPAAGTSLASWRWPPRWHWDFEGEHGAKPRGEPAAAPPRYPRGRARPARHRCAVAGGLLLITLLVADRDPVARPGLDRSNGTQHEDDVRREGAPCARRRPTRPRTDQAAVASVLAYTPFIKEGSHRVPGRRAHLRRRPRPLHARSPERPRGQPRAGDLLRDREDAPVLQPVDRTRAQGRRRDRRPHRDPPDDGRAVGPRTVRRALRTARADRSPRRPQAGPVPAPVRVVQRDDLRRAPFSCIC